MIIVCERDCAGQDPAAVAAMIFGAERVARDLVVVLALATGTMPRPAHVGQPAPEIDATPPPLPQAADAVEVAPSDYQSEALPDFKPFRQLMS